MKRNKLKVLSSLAILGIAGLGLAACNNNTGSGTTQSPTTTPTENGGGATTPTPTPTPVPTTPSQSTTTTPNKSSTNTPEQNKIESISVSGQTKEFLPGSEFVFGGTVTKNYSDGSQVVATEEEYIVTIYTDNSYETEAENIKTAGTYYVVVSIGDKLATYEIVVREAQQTIHELADMSTLEKNDSVKNNTNIYSKNSNEVYITANSSKGAKIGTGTKSYEGNEFTNYFNLNGSTDLKKGENVVTAEGVVTTPRVAVIKVAQAGKVTIYGMPSDNVARSLCFVDSNGEGKEEASLKDKSKIEAYSYNVEAGTYYFYVGATNSELGTTAGGFYIYGIGIEYEVPASSVTYSEIKVQTKNARTDFNVGTEFDKTGLVVKGLSNLGTWEELTDYKITNEDGSDVSTANVGKYKLKVTYGELTDYYDIQILNPEATVTNIEVKHAADQLVYKKGEALDLTGLVITATDSDSLVQDISYDKDVISYKVLSGENDVTNTFTELTKGAYKVELTYKSATTTYDITMLEAKEGKFEKYETEVAIGSDSYASSLVISYTDGTDVDWSKYNDTILSTVDGYSTKFYSDEACTTAFDSASKAFEAAGTVYVKLLYRDYTKTINVTVKNMIKESYYIKDHLTTDNNYKNQVLFDSSLIKVTTGSEAKTAGSPTNTVAIKMDKKPGKEITFEVKEKIVLKIIVNGNGDGKNYNLKDSKDATKIEGSVNKTTDADTVVVVTLDVGTYKFATSSGGLYFAGIEATKAE